MATRLILLLALFSTAAACESASGNSPNSAASMPTAVSCHDAPQLRQRSIDDRHRGETTKSDQERVIANSRASYFAALATVADLMCRIPAVQTEPSLAQAFQATRRAEETRSFYEEAVALSEANLRVTETIAAVLRQLPAPSSK